LPPTPPKGGPGLFFFGKFDGLVKSPSAALRGNFVVAALEGRGPSRTSLLGFARLASGAFYETIVPLTFYEIIKFDIERIILY
jgi:hypothetical protein